MVNKIISVRIELQNLTFEGLNSTIFDGNASNKTTIKCSDGYLILKNIFGKVEDSGMLALCVFLAVLPKSFHFKGLKNHYASLHS